MAETLVEGFAHGILDPSVEKSTGLLFLFPCSGAGLRHEKQPSLWISDHDETFDSFDRRERFARLATYLSYGLTRWQNPARQDFMTTGARNLPAWVEDLAAIPDIAAGACAQLIGVLPTFVAQGAWMVSMLHEVDRDWRARIFGEWLSTPRGALRHVLLWLAPDKQGEIRASAQNFSAGLS
ncbi:hypothetical protein LGH83_12145 [Lichenihabitans sp. PAMC28606]|uniref:hypothetical protein n=1 Tax=Lichenihabitans sp. PAMC28606 TaxID=2880932 RepID=UPI001D0A62D7|nr:hypothetical protein [Lichenihabitans sp. PAMC28606]UDL93337.1 hypothetical protein LGH83_12145 [Lichenihabitans sp. PAMC28606]